MTDGLPLLTPDPQRAMRTATRCHARLAHRRKRLDAAARSVNALYLAVERAFVGALCVIYLSAVALIAIQVLSGR